MRFEFSERANKKGEATDLPDLLFIISVLLCNLLVVLVA